VAIAVGWNLSGFYRYAVSSWLHVTAPLTPRTIKLSWYPVPPAGGISRVGQFWAAIDRNMAKLDVQVSDIGIRELRPMTLD